MDTGDQRTLADLRDSDVDLHVKANVEKAIRLLVDDLSHEYPCFKNAENMTPEECIRLIDEYTEPQKESADWPLVRLAKLYEAKVALLKQQRGMP